MTSVYFYIGTIAELIKVFPVMIELNKKGIDYKIISSGQNNLDDSELFDFFDIPKPEYTLSSGPTKKNALGLLLWVLQQTISGFIFLRKHIANPKDKIMVVHGDTVSTVMGALIGKTLGMQVAHIEAGLRSYNFLNPFPEEIDRLLTSRLADIYFAPNDWALKNLSGMRGKLINTHANTLLDSLHHANHINLKSEILNSLKNKNYFVFVMHRQENLFDSIFFEKVLNRILEQSKVDHCVFVLHELTKNKLRDCGLLGSIEHNENITTVPRLPYIEFMKVLLGASYIVTDGGSNQEESFYMGLPCLILRSHTERVEGLDANVLLSGKNMDTIDDFLKNIEHYRKNELFREYTPSLVIAETLENFIENI